MLATLVDFITVGFMVPPCSWKGKFQRVEEFHGTTTIIINDNNDNKNKNGICLTMLQIKVTLKWYGQYMGCVSAQSRKAAKPQRSAKHCDRWSSPASLVNGGGFPLPCLITRGELEASNMWEIISGYGQVEPVEFRGCSMGISGS